MLEKLSNLHLLLRSPYFSQWPLKLQFFSEDVYKAWQSWCERADEQLHPSINVILDLPQAREPEDDEITSGQKPKKRRKVDLVGKGGIEGIDPTYAGLKDVLQKGQFLLDENDGQKCAVCSQDLNLGTDLYTVCPHGQCQSLSHVNCLSRHFLGENTDTFMPKRGNCPSCRRPLDWHSLMKEVTLRTRNPKEVAKILKKKQKSVGKDESELLDTETEDELEVEESDQEEEYAMGIVEEDARSEVSMLSLSGSSSPARQSSPIAHEKAEIVIEDSDEDR
jgi:structure-specific endonuclease subunit SLX1